jgi:hypothetical protein
MTMSDGFASKRAEQRRLREVTRRATTPAVTVNRLAQETHLSPKTIYGFVAGAALREENAESLRDALLRLLPSEVA